jgi:hypothetical protein
MNKLIVTLLLATCAATPAVAEVSGTWGWYCIGDTRVIVGTEPGATDSLDPSDSPIDSDAYGWYIASYRVKGADGWDAATGLYAYDLRAPLTAGQTKTWDLYAWAVPGTITPADLYTQWGWRNRDPVITACLQLLHRPASVVGGPAEGTMWTTPPADLALPYYATPDPLAGYKFRFTLTMIPEPSSTAALVAGFSGLGGLALKRRRG